MRFGQWLGLIGLAAALVLLWTLRGSLILVFAAIVLATALCTVIGWVRQRLDCPRPVAMVLALLLIALLLGVVATAVIPPFVGQFSQLLVKLPEAGAELLQLLRGAMAAVSHMLYGSDDAGLSWLRKTFSNPPQGFGEGLGAGASRLLNLAGDLGGGLVQTLFVLAVALMIASQPAAYRDVVVLLLPSFYRRRGRQVLNQCGTALRAWVVGVAISSLCVGTLAAIGLTLLGVKLVAANAVLAGLLNVIPNVGPTLSTLFPLSVALLDSPWRALAVLLLYVAVQNLESYVITPSVMHHQLRLLPGLTLTAQLLFTMVFGPLGLLLALPMAVCVQVIVRNVLIHDILDPWKRQRLSG